jgi:lipopolysaccharide biosynthesis glycosyltransferase
VACVLVLFNVGKPWSEDTPGLGFETWWQGHYSEWHGLTWTDLQGLQQQQEWVTGWPTRPGINALAKPLGALSLSAREGVSPPPGGGVVKLVLRQVQCSNPANELKLTADGRKLVGVLQLAQGMGTMEVSRDNLYRSRPDTMASLFPHRPDFEKVSKRLQKALSIHYAEMVGPTAGSMPHSGASSSSAAPAKPNPQQLFEKKKIFRAGIQVLDAAMQEAGPTPTEQ